jgi:hypothetical protein
MFGFKGVLSTIDFSHRFTIAVTDQTKHVFEIEVRLLQLGWPWGKWKTSI